jgi:N-acyl homoserine lactone hydrolase
MKRTLVNLAAGACLAVLALPAQAADLSLARLADCGTPQAPIAVNQRFCFPGPQASVRL